MYTSTIHVACRVRSLSVTMSTRCKPHQIVSIDNDIDKMDHGIETTTTSGTEPSSEIHWIESKSLFTASTAKNNNSENTGTSSTNSVDDNHKGQDDNLHDEDLCLDDLFIDPDPYETFTLQWKILYRHDDKISTGAGDLPDPGSSCDDHDTHSTTNTTATETSAAYGLVERTAQITVVGNKAENGQTLHSTGLTLWRASRLLTDYMVALHNQRQTAQLQVGQRFHDASIESSYSNSAIPNSKSSQNSIGSNYMMNRGEYNNISSRAIAVLELGCGLGIPSMLYHYYLRSQLLLSPSSLSSSCTTSSMTNTITIATDADSDTLQNLRQNLQLVQEEQERILPTSPFENTKSMHEKTHNIITCQQLIWGNSMHIQSVLQTLRSYCNRLEQSTATADSATAGDKSFTKMDDWASSADGKFDILLGSDIIYVEHVVAPLFTTVSQLLSPHGVFLLAFARRNVSIDYVLVEARRQGFVYEYHELADIHGTDTPTTSPRNSSSSTEGVYIFRLRP